MRNSTRLGLVSLALLSSTLVLPAWPAAAAPSEGVGTAAVCARTYNARTDQLDANRNYWYDIPRHHNVDCSTISIRSLEASSVCAGFRLRIFPSSGGSYTEPRTGFRYLCGGQAANLATNYKLGTEYRLESTRQNMDARVRD